MGVGFRQFHIRCELALLQQLPNSCRHILPTDNLRCPGILCAIAIGKVHTVLAIPCGYLGIPKLDAVSSLIGLFQIVRQGFHRLLLGKFIRYPHSVIHGVAANAKHLIDVLLGHGKSGGCCFCTLRFCDILNLLRFGGEHGQLFAADRFPKEV